MFCNPGLFGTASGDARARRSARRHPSPGARSVGAIALVLAVLCSHVFVVPVSAQAAAVGSLEDDPGYFPLEELDLLERDELSVEINLQGAMLSMISAFLGSDDPELAELVSGLRGVRVRTAELDSERLEALRGRLPTATEWLESHGWQPVVRVRESSEEVYIYMHGDGDAMDGLTILATESGEATVVNLVGEIDLARLSVLVEGFDLPASAAGGEEDRP